MDFREKVARLNASLDQLYSYKEEYVRLKEKEKDLSDAEWMNGETNAFVDKYIDPLINSTLQDLKEVALFFCDLEKEIKNTYIKQILSDKGDLSDVTENDIEKFYAVIQDDKLYHAFLDERIPEALKEFGISKEEYEQIKNESANQSDSIKSSLDDIFRKAVLEPDLDNPEARQAFFNRIVNEMIEEDKAKLSGAETKDLTVQDMINTESSESLTIKFNPNIGVTEKLKGGFNFNPER